MKVNELGDFLQQQLAFPVERTTVIEEIGSVELEAPDGGTGGTIAETLEPLNEGAYDSPDALLHAIVGTLGDRYIGRKFYDDRGTNPEAGAEYPEFPASDSF